MSILQGDWLFPCMGPCDVIVVKKGEAVFFNIFACFSKLLYSLVKIVRSIDLMHNDVTRLDAREECWS